LVSRVGPSGLLVFVPRWSIVVTIVLSARLKPPIGCAWKKNNNRQNTLMHNVNRHNHDVYFWNFATRRIAKSTKIASRGAICTLKNLKHELSSNITRLRYKYTAMSVTTTYIPYNIIIWSTRGWKNPNFKYGLANSIAKIYHMINWR